MSILTRVPGLVAATVVVFVVLIVVSLGLARRQAQLVCDAIVDNRAVIAQLVAVRRQPVDPADYPGELGAALAEMQRSADEFAHQAAVILDTPPECER